MEHYAYTAGIIIFIAIIKSFFGWIDEPQERSNKPINIDASLTDKSVLPGEISRDIAVTYDLPSGDSYTTIHRT